MALIDLTHTLRPARAPRHPGFSLTTILQVWRSRQALARLDADALDDIGLTAKRAAKEAAKPVWDVPHTWRK